MRELRLSTMAFQCSSILAKKNLLEHAWCEKTMQSQLNAALEHVDDGLGTRNKNEIFFLEAASFGVDEEDVGHTLEDTLILIVEYSNFLIHLMKKNKGPYLESFMKKPTFGVQIIEDTLTLTKMNIKKNGKYKYVELRSSAVPTNWDNRAQWTKLLELLATAYIKLFESKALNFTLVEEAFGLEPISGVILGRHFKTL